jgi:glycosyltransferase involved in cell wall biosynthesis
MRALASRLGLSDFVTWSGFLGPEEKLSAMAAATIYVLPSYSESFGIALLEALCAGLPCVVTTGVALSEEVQGHDAGLVVSPKLSEISAAILRLAGSQELRQKLSTNGRRLAFERFSMEAMGAALETLYQRVLDGPVPQPDCELAAGRARN